MQGTPRACDRLRHSRLARRAHTRGRGAGHAGDNSHARHTTGGAMPMGDELQHDLRFADRDDDDADLGGFEDTDYADDDDEDEDGGSYGGIPRGTDSLFDSPDEDEDEDFGIVDEEGEEDEDDADLFGSAGAVSGARGGGG